MLFFIIYNWFEYILSLLLTYLSLNEFNKWIILNSIIICNF